MGALCCRSTRIHDEPTTCIVTNHKDSEDSAIGNLLIFVNPNSGSGKGVQIFNSKVAVELKRNKISYELVITTSLNHAKSIVRERDDLTKFNGILILSGDGLIYEVLNGLRGRCDSNIILPSLPIGIVPSGSGNGLLSSLFANKGEPLKNPKFMKRAVEISCSPAAQAQPINLIDVQTDKENITAFLSIGWGIMADIDIESERWRRVLGSNRFIVGGLIRILRLRTYRGCLSFKPYSSGKLGTADVYSVYDKTVEARVIY